MTEAAEFVSLADLAPWDRNPRVNDHVVGELADSLKIHESKLADLRSLSNVEPVSMDDGPREKYQEESEE